jgi:RNA polymerase sigma-70 factor (ECF subfamily)
LVAALVAGDAGAWRVFHRHFDRLALVCIARVTRPFPFVSADDVREIHAQWHLSLLLRGKARLRAFQPSRGGRLSTYVGMLAAHCAYDWLRTRRREPRRVGLAHAAKLVSEAADPFDAAVRAERWRLAARALAAFTERDRRFAALYLGEGLSPREVARAMQITVRTVYTKKHKIKARLEFLVPRETAALPRAAVP